MGKMVERFFEEGNGPDPLREFALEIEEEAAGMAKDSDGWTPEAGRVAAEQEESSVDTHGADPNDVGGSS